MTPVSEPTLSEQIAEIEQLRDSWLPANPTINAVLTTLTRLRDGREALLAGAFACEFKANRDSKKHAAALRLLAGDL